MFEWWNWGQGEGVAGLTFVESLKGLIAAGQ